MATATQTEDLLNELDQKVAQLREAVQALTEASGRVSQPEPDTASPAPSPPQE